jgi:hypothetical protein
MLAYCNHTVKYNRFIYFATTKYYFSGPECRWRNCKEETEGAGPPNRVSKNINQRKRREVELSCNGPIPYTCWMITRARWFSVNSMQVVSVLDINIIF